MTVKIEQRIGVQAPPERLWEVLSDLEGWKRWNPLNPSVEGRLAIGSELKVEQRWPGRETETVQARVLDWVPLEQIHWRTSRARGWVWTVRYMEIEALGPTNCVFSVGELFGGLLGGQVAKRMGPSMRAGFKAFCEALRVEAETAPAGVQATEPKIKAVAATIANAPPKKKAPLQPVVLKTYAPEPLGMKKKKP